MRLIRLLPALMLLTTFCFAAEPANLEVHEWGTFTTVSGSDGVPLSWWQPLGAPATELPPFVQRNLFFSKGASFLLRMETPVIYFYPEKPMPVEVRAAMSGGHITEWFPTPAGSKSIQLSNSGAPTPPTIWTGRLIPPTDLAALKAQPSVGQVGAEYAHARAVPDAWLFQSENSSSRALETEKFIFYRGASNSVLPYRVSARENGSLELSHLAPDGAALEHAFAVQTSGGDIRWARMPRLVAAGSVVSGNTNDSVAELARAMVEALAASGLTPAEAEAMVATWNGQWFAEEGARVLAILPQAVVDHLLPLTIQPTPRKTVRVFVTRFEIFTPQREAEILALLEDQTFEGDEVKRMGRFRDLRLGRFATAALARVQNVVSRRLQERFASLNVRTVGN